MRTPNHFDEWEPSNVRDHWTDHLFGVYRFALHLCDDPHLAEDLAQEAMLRAVRQGEKLRDPGRLRIWLLRVVENLWRDWCRLKQRRPSDRLPDEEVGVQQMLPCEEASLAEEVVRTMNAMGELPERIHVSPGFGVGALRIKSGDSYR